MSSCQPVKEQPSAPLPVISVDGNIIDEARLANELQYHQHPDFDVVVQKAGQALVIRQLLLNQAQREGIEITADNEEQNLQQLISEKVSYQDPDEQDCSRYFENNPDKFTTMPLMEVDHILLAAAKDDLPARDLAKQQGQNIISRLQQDPQQFAALAKEYSACPSKQTAGSLGQLSKGQTVPEFERQIMLLPEGLADKPIASRYGFHVVNISRKIAGKTLEYSMVADKVRSYLTHRASHLAIQAFIQQLVENAEIKGIAIQFSEQNIHL